VRDTFRLNNFDVLRLGAALQVALEHATFHLEVHPGWWGTISAVVPGVPIFFFISGFLISRSYESNSRLEEYSRNRALRIYPALVVCTALSLLSVAAVGYFDTVAFSIGHFVAWVLGQVTVVQFYNPDFMRAFGTGVLNGSLWTITVELQFYVLIPALYWILRRLERRRIGANATLAGLTLVFLAANVAFHALGIADSKLIASKLIKASFVPWFYMFLVGVVAQRNFAALHRWLAHRFWAIAPAYLIAAVTGVLAFGLSAGNRIHPLLYLGLAASIFAGAYSRPQLAERLLRRNDVSYGVYIYHVPVINLLMYYGLLGRSVHVAVAVASAIALATLSWFCVERPAIRRKKHPLSPLTDGVDDSRPGSVPPASQVGCEDP
jgi:peptidoglycan/LPS O-acetylase OafA/YrhL